MAVATSACKVAAKDGSDKAPANGIEPYLQFMRQQLGGKLTPELIMRYSASPNWKDGRFQNLEETIMKIPLGKLPGIIYRQLVERSAHMPKHPIPVFAFDTKAFLRDTDTPHFIWYGHSCVLVRMNGKTILIDPMLGPNASPVGPISIPRFSPNTLDLIGQFPPIDLVLLSHDHYDHLDLKSIRLLQAKTAKWIVALGVGRHLESWGIPAAQISEMDWWDHVTLQNIAIHFTPSRHFSGRGLRDRFKSLWGGFLLDTSKEKTWFSGDGGYGKHFKMIGEKFGPIDLGFMECGQYNQNWHDIHMYPEESVQAALDANVSRAMAVHWGAFALAQHCWRDPVERFTTEANNRKLDFIQPVPGEIFERTSGFSAGWWERFD